MKPSEDMSDAPLLEDAAPFDQVEALARSLCAAGGGQWDARHHKRNHWRRKALAVLQAERPRPAGAWARLRAWLRRLLP